MYLLIHGLLVSGLHVCYNTVYFLPRDMIVSGSLYGLPIPEVCVCSLTELTMYLVSSY